MINNEEEVSSSEQENEELYEHHNIICDKGQELLRIDKFLMTRIQNLSRNKVQIALHAGNITVNKKNVKPNYRVKPGDIISVIFSHPPKVAELICENIPLDIIYEDDDLLVINKAAGMVVHPAYGHYKGTLVNAVAYHLHPHMEGKVIMVDETLRPGLVHRIDKNTSGLMVLSKNDNAMAHLVAQFYNRTIQRHYWALVWGDVKQNEGTVTGHIGRNIANRKVMDVFADGSHGKHAVTHYTVLKRFTYTTLIQCKLETGRTHQIRVHMKHIGHPIFGDFEYGGDKILKGNTSGSYMSFIQKQLAIMPYQALHARSLGFMHPVTKKEIYFETDPPSNYKQLIESWENYSSNTLKNK